MDAGSLGVLIPITAIICWTVVRVVGSSRSTAAIRDQQAGGGDLGRRLEALEEEVRGVREELAETQERLDFSERLLSQVAETKRPPSGT